jgi:hypothetical protein
LESATELCPPITEPPALRTHAIFADCQPATGQIYSDATGLFLAPSSAGHSYLLIDYNYDSNAIFAKSKSEPEHLAAYKRIHFILLSRGLQPQL